VGAEWLQKFLLLFFLITNIFAICVPFSDDMSNVYNFGDGNCYIRTSDRVYTSYSYDSGCPSGFCKYRSGSIQQGAGHTDYYNAKEVSCPSAYDAQMGHP